MSAENWVTIGSIILGPILAVLAAQYLQSRERKRERQLYVLRALMSTRKAQLHPDRIMALNLIDIEFAANSRVIGPFRELIKIYNDTERWKSEDAEARKRLFDDVDDASVRLIEAISKSLGYRYDNIDILRGGYYPDGLAVQEEQNRVIREFFVGMREGKLFLPVALLDARHPKQILEQAQEAMIIMEAAQKNDGN